MILEATIISVNDYTPCAVVMLTTRQTEILVQARETAGGKC